MEPKSMLAAFLCVCGSFSHAQADEMPWVVVAKHKKSFVLEPSGKPFTLWSFNYDHDTEGRLIEDYWDKEWDKVETPFAQMKKLGANVVRIADVPPWYDKLLEKGRWDAQARCWEAVASRYAKCFARKTNRLFV